jgi:hypothetical protein
METCTLGLPMVVNSSMSSAGGLRAWATDFQVVDLRPLKNLATTPKSVVVFLVFQDSFDDLGLCFGHAVAVGLLKDGEGILIVSDGVLAILDGVIGVHFLVGLAVFSKHGLLLVDGGCSLVVCRNNFAIME